MKPITDHDRLLAREVINAACYRYLHGKAGPDLPETRDEIINERWPVRGNGGVDMSNCRTRLRVYAAIAEFYALAPTEY